MLLLGVDPSLRATGLSIVEGDRVLAWRVIRTEPKEGSGAQGDKLRDQVRRLRYLATEFTVFLDEYEPDLVCFEAQVGASFGKASMANVAKLVGAYHALVVLCPNDPVVIAADEIRKRLRGRRKVEKIDVERYCRAHFGERHPPVPKSRLERESVWDATAVILAIEPDLERS